MTTAQQTKFIELRAKGLSLTQIATELDVCKRTLVNWGHKLENEIQAHYALEQEALREQLIGFREQRLRRQGELLARVETELQKRSLADLSTARLFTMAESLRRQILKETTSNLPPLPAPDEQDIECESAEPVSAAEVSSHQAVVPIANEAEDRCKNGATLVQSPAGSIPSPPLEAEGNAPRLRERERVAQPGEGCGEKPQLVLGEEEHHGAPRLDLHQPSTKNNQPHALSEEPQYLYPRPTDPELLQKWCWDHRHLSSGCGPRLTLPGYVSVRKAPEQLPPEPAPKDQCKNGATSHSEPSLQSGPKTGAAVVQSSNQLQEAGCDRPTPPDAVQHLTEDYDNGERGPLSNEQTTIESPLRIEPLFDARVLAAEIAREIRLKFETK